MVFTISVRRDQWSLNNLYFLLKWHGTLPSLVSECYFPIVLHCLYIKSREDTSRLIFNCVHLFLFSNQSRNLKNIVTFKQWAHPLVKNGSKLLKYCSAISAYTTVLIMLSLKISMIYFQAKISKRHCRNSEWNNKNSQTFDHPYLVILTTCLDAFLKQISICVRTNLVILSETSWSHGAAWSKSFWLSWYANCLVWLSHTN